MGELNNQGIYVLLDHHRPDCNVISEFWYINGYSEQQWISDLAFMAQRYKGFANFLGIDLETNRTEVPPGERETRRLIEIPQLRKRPPLS